MKNQIEVNDELIEKANEEITKTVEWSHVVGSLKSRKTETPSLSFLKVLKQKIFESPFGTFLRMPKTVPVEDKEIVLGLLKFQWERSSRTLSDVICDHPLKLIEKILSTSSNITRKSIFDNLTELRLIDAGITYVDKSIKMLVHLKLLNLSGNWIEDIPGGYLPRNLSILELHANQLRSVQSLGNDLPRTLLHLGLGRNKLQDDSAELEVFEGTGLRSLDLSGNDFEDLLKTLEKLSKIPYLIAISLEDNPCSMCYLYREAVITQLPELIFLDSILLNEQDRQIPNEEILDLLEEGTKDGTLCFYCFRIMGLQQPKKNEVFNKKKVVQNFQIEVDFPLFDPVRKLNYIKKFQGSEAYFEEQEEKILPSSMLYQSLEPPKGGKPLDGPQENEEETSKKIMRFKTSRQTWNKVIEFPSPCLRIRTSRFSGLKNLRDTFRSNINIKLFYLKTVPPDKPAKKPAAGVAVEEPKEIIASKTEIANFKVPLESISWADLSLDYSFVEKRNDIDPEAQLLPGSLGEMQYKEMKDAKKAPKKAEGLIPVPIPTELTIHVGFGLQRKMPSVNDLIPEKMAGKKK